jgi:uncharacterized protein (TIGR02391 family)
MRRPSDPILFQEGVIEQIARLIGATDSEFSNNKIERAFARLNIKEVNPPTGNQIKAKWRRIDDTLVGHQRRTNSGQVVVRFIEDCVNPGNFMDRPDRFDHWRDALNGVLVFEGLSISRAGKVEKGSKAETLDEAAKIADSLIAELKRRAVHPTVLAFCDRELLQKDLFHGVHEATKSVFERLRQATTETSDGSELIEALFGLGNGAPVIAINDCDTESEKSEHKGFANLMKGAYGIWRNTTAHDARAVSEVKRQEVLDALGTLSYIHRRLDSAVNVHTGETVK